jgi:hypothetical protein
VSIFNSILNRVVDSKSLVFTKFRYDSQDEKLKPFLNGSPEQKLSDVLSNFGLGELRD